MKSVRIVDGGAYSTKSATLTIRKTDTALRAITPMGQVMENRKDGGK